MPEPSYKRPESVLVLVYTHDAEVLMLRRRQPDDFWQSVTGSLGWEETAAQAARRELYEETAIQVAPEQLIDCHIRNRFPILPSWRARYAPEVSHNLEYVFRVMLAARSEVRLNPAEHLAYQWLPAQAAAELASSYTNRDAILRWVAQPEA